MVWAVERGSQELRWLRGKIRKLEQDNLLWQVEKKRLEKLEQDTLTLRADIAALKRGW